MKPKTIKITYWILTSLFALFAIFDGIGGVTRQQAGIDALNMLGYPAYYLTIAGVAKILGAIGILQTKYTTIKEWAFAGFAFQSLGASASWSYVGAEPFPVIFPLFVLAFMFVTYFFWKKYEQVKANAYFHTNSYTK
ncbi:DoxX family protein [Chitinophaga barathri]|uniref:DoxX family protein n=1 Tax=Chitinophaga barathri TaxID=1647451 RepID=A0A3N4MS55_9BACT|nr:DoxX family protein [Chitinophaga barathri]RPD38223.1 DoxX family protein [Chitinophaga barathri]